MATTTIVALGGVSQGQPLAECEQLRLPAVDLRGVSDEVIGKLLSCCDWEKLTPLPERRTRFAAVAVWLTLPTSSSETAVHEEPEPESPAAIGSDAFCATAAMASAGAGSEGGAFEGFKEVD